MRILFVCHRFPYPPKRGGKIRPFNIVKHFHENGHKVTVASVARNKAEALEGSGIEAYCESYHVETIGILAAVGRMLWRLPQSTPSSLGNFFSPQLARTIKSLIQTQKFDLVFVHCSSAAQYVEWIADTPKVLDFGDIDSQKWLIYANKRRLPLSLGYWLEGTKLQREEKRLAHRFDLCTCTTRAELETFDDFNTGVSSGWYPNGVDTAYFSPTDEPYDPFTICFVGRMDYYPNQEAMINFCAKVLPNILSAEPKVELKIVGANPSAAIKRLGRLASVTVTGSVLDVRPYVTRSALTVAPLSIARGTQNKILESMAMGVPVIASHEAAGGVDAIPGEHILVGESDADICDKTLRLLRNPDERKKLSIAGLNRVLSNHNWSNSMRMLDTLLAEHFPGVTEL